MTRWGDGGGLGRLPQLALQPALVLAALGMMIGTNSDVDGGPSMTKWFAVGKWMGEGVGGGGGGGEEGSGCQCRGGSRHRWRHGGGGRQG